ncbi:hypothetical protein FRACYDRAFT_225495 [Fragilariopsis cylindrus CCMP1102]|uniref:MYND-type domain-containing protein n=1 Tax=Fragilariopsis cylindrus CCMP1102 TaxID=635003 RepID=A0A1E7FIZ7_9STRA|nr:hypothetical protein FRACYDRAFT_225495 [Fragilariopsis cylindrus CCMP1102]|eukprot:OEU18152.1 hypothetical protein FRACYDRAFT_225495 [Fragilariopsis cylindrus CCMP1102]
MVTDSDGFPTSDFFQRGVHLIENGGVTETIFNNVVGIYLRGAETGCIPSMVNYANCYLSQYKPHLALPFLLEGAIRGHPDAVALLLCRCYANLPQFSLYFYWSNMVKNWAGIEEERYKQFFGGAKKMKNQFDNTCCICSEQQSDLVDLKTCNGCKLSFYCSKECQTIHWEERNHKNECNQLKILMKYHKPYANEIREQIMSGDDPKSIIPLQKLRNKLGLTRPRKEYEEYLDLKNLDNDLDTSTSTTNDDTINPHTLLIPRNNGTVYVGSWTETM